MVERRVATLSRLSMSGGHESSMASASHELAERGDRRARNVPRAPAARGGRRRRVLHRRFPAAARWEGFKQRTGGPTAARGPGDAQARCSGECVRGARSARWLLGVAARRGLVGGAQGGPSGGGQVGAGGWRTGV